MRTAKQRIRYTCMYTALPDACLLSRAYFFSGPFSTFRNIDVDDSSGYSLCIGTPGWLLGHWERMKGKDGA